MTEKNNNRRTLEKPFLRMQTDVGAGVKMARRKGSFRRACVTVCTSGPALPKASFFANSSNGSCL